MASLTSFLSRRQTDRTTLTFGSCVFMLKQPSPNLFRGNVLATSPGESKLKNSLHATASNNHSDRRRYSKHTRLRARRSHAIGELLLEIAGRSLPTKGFRFILINEGHCAFIHHQTPLPMKKKGIAWQAREPWASDTRQAIIVFNFLVRRCAF